MGYSPIAIHSKCPLEAFLNDDEKKCQGGVFSKHVVCGPLATDQGKCHSLFKLLFSVLFLNLCALVVHMYLVVCILRVELGFTSFVVDAFLHRIRKYSTGRHNELCDS